MLSIDQMTMNKN